MVPYGVIYESYLRIAFFRETANMWAGTHQKSSKTVVKSIPVLNTLPAYPRLLDMPGACYIACPGVFFSPGFIEFMPLLAS